MQGNQSSVIPAHSEEQVELLAKAFAEGFVYLAEYGLLGEFQDAGQAEVGSNKA